MDPSNRVKGLLLMAMAIAAGLPCMGCDGLVGLDAPASDQADADCTDAMTSCAGRCSDLQIDPDNCGSCGHGCLGAPCASGYCQPEVLAVGSPASLALDDAGLYWTDTATARVMRCPLGGCPDAGGEVFFDRGDAGGPSPGSKGGGPPVFGGLAVGGGQVLFSVNDPAAALPDGGTSPGLTTIYTCPASGCGGTPTVLAEEPGPGFGLVTASPFVFWIQSADFSVHVCSSPACPGGPWAVEGPSADLSPWELAADGDYVYYGTPGNNVAWCAVAVDSGGNCNWDVTIGNVQPFYALAHGPTGLYGTTGDRVLWIQPNFVDWTMTTATPLALVQSPGNLALDDVQVYFTSQDEGGAIYRCPLGGCSGSPFLVAEGLGTLGDIKVDAERIYVIVEGNAVVWLAK
jgi:hypothetical protein